jgi:hypothetical protein
MIMRDLPMGESNTNHTGGNNTPVIRPDVIAGFKVLVSTFEALSFFVVVYVLGIVSGILEQFMFVWLVEIGGTGTVRMRYPVEQTYGVGGVDEVNFTLYQTYQCDVLVLVLDALWFLSPGR